jgi:starch synthase
MLASENDALPGGKVGGVGDVVRDVPRALAALGCTVTVVTPGYGFLANIPGAVKKGEVVVQFCGKEESVELFEVPGRTQYPGVRHCVLENPLMQSGGRIFWDDPSDAPFATDARKFALFCAASGQAALEGLFGSIDVLHLHDWHSAVLAILRRYLESFLPLQRARCVITLHNLALQGVRPFEGHWSSFKVWFPQLSYEHAVLADRRWPDCVNPMAAAIRLVDAVHVVSPRYAEEILAPSDVAQRGYYGGEGLEQDLAQAKDQGRLHGILNGCEYPNKKPTAPDWSDLLRIARDQIIEWIAGGGQVSAVHFVAYARLTEWLERGRRPSMVVTSVGRCVDQKIRLMSQATSSGRSALDQVLDSLGEKGVFICLGTGDPEYERFLCATAGRHTNMIFLLGYSDMLAQALYGGGDLFLMPSCFEPCGISQMLAMRSGQACLVHDVGGLHDTVVDGVTGFVFSGDTQKMQADALHACFVRALGMCSGQTTRWTSIRAAAAAKRFNWSDSVQAYRKQLYRC